MQQSVKANSDWCCFRHSMSHRKNCRDSAPQECFYGHMKEDSAGKKAHWIFTENARCGIDDWFVSNNHDRYQRQLAKLSSSQFYQYVSSEEYPLPCQSSENVIQGALPLDHQCFSHVHQGRTTMIFLALTQRNRAKCLVPPLWETQMMLGSHLCVALSSVSWLLHFSSVLFPGWFNTIIRSEGSTSHVKPGTTTFLFYLGYWAVTQ